MRMKNTVISMRQIQRHYRKLVDEAKKTKKPLYLGRRQLPEAVLLDIDVFENLQKRNKAPFQNWQQLKKTLGWIKRGGRQDLNLASFINADRKTH